MAILEWVDNNVDMTADTRWRAPRQSRDYCGKERNFQEKHVRQKRWTHLVHNRSNATKQRLSCGKSHHVLRLDLDNDFVIGRAQADGCCKLRCATSLSNVPRPQWHKSDCQDALLSSGLRLTIAGRLAAHRKAAAMASAREIKREQTALIQDTIRSASLAFSAAMAAAREIRREKTVLIQDNIRSSSVAFSAAPALAAQSRTVAAISPVPLTSVQVGVRAASRPRHAAPVHYRTAADAPAISEEGEDDYGVEDELFDLNVAMLSGHAVSLSVYSGHTIYHVKDELRAIDGTNYTLLAPGKDNPASDWQTMLDLGIGPESNCLFAMQCTRMKCEHCNLRFRLDATLSLRGLQNCPGPHCGEWVRSEAGGEYWSCCHKTKWGSPGCARGSPHSWMPVA
jgi:hypothetical protein